MTTLYRTILKEAWNITKNNRWLWWLGLFAALLGNGGIFNLLIKNLTTVQNQGEIITDLNSVFNQGALGTLISTFSEVVTNLDIVSILVMLVIAIIFLFLLWLASVTQGGLISGAFRLHKQQPTNFKESWQRGVRKFWPVLGLNLTTSIVTYVALIILGLPFFFLYVWTDSLAWQWVFLLISYLIFVPLAVIIASIVQYGVVFVVIKNSEFLMSIKEGWQLFKKNWIVTIEMALALFVINVFSGLLVLIGVMFVLLPFWIMAYIGLQFELAFVFDLALMLGLLVLAAIIFTFGAVLSVFQTTTWVVLFRQLTEGKMIPKIVRLLAKWGVFSQKSSPTI